MTGKLGDLSGEIPVITDHRGSLCFAEAGKHVPFEIKRFFTLFAVQPGQVRGNHAHRECHQWIVCLTGRVKLAVHDGSEERVLQLESPKDFLHAPPLHWVTLSEFSADAVVLVLTSHLFDANDYIGIWDDFVRLTRLPSASPS